MAGGLLYGAGAFILPSMWRVVLFIGGGQTCIDLSSSLYFLFFSFDLVELKSFVLKGKVLGENSEKVCKSAKNVKIMNDFALQLLPFSFSLILEVLYLRDSGDSLKQKEIPKAPDILEL